MSRFLAMHENRAGAEGWRLWLVFVFGALVLALAFATSATAATAYYSFTGSFTDGSETQSFLFNTDRAFAPRTVPFWLRTWHAEGGTNAADGWIDPGGFNPFLRLYNDTPAHIATNNDYPPGLDSLIDWHTLGMPETLPRDGYRVDLASESGALGDGDGHWAVDLVGPAERMTLRGASDDGPDGSTITSLWMGTDGADRTPAALNLGMFENLTVAGGLFVAWTGNATVNVTTGSLATYWGALGNTPGSEGSVTLSQGGNWTTAENASNSWIGGNGTGNLRIESGGLARFGRRLLLGLNEGEGNVTVTGDDSYLIVNHDLLVGEFGVGYLRVEDRGQVNSSGVGPPFEGDFIGHLNGSYGTVEVDGKDSLWQTDLLTVGDYGQGTIAITGGGQIDTLGNAYIGRFADYVDSSVAVTGAAPDGTPSMWRVSGDLHVAGSDTGPAAVNNSRLTVNPGALVEVTGTTTNHGEGWIELHGGTLRTGALASTGRSIDWTSGALELTNSGLILDSVMPDSMFGNSLTVGAGQSLALTWPTPVQWRQLFVGLGGGGTLTVQGGGVLKTGYGVPTVIALALGSTGTVTVTGKDSNWNLEGPLEVGGIGNGSLNITAGGKVIHLSGWHSDVARDEGVGRVLVDGDDSLWDVSRLTIGTFGDGYLTVSGGGHVVSDGSYLAWNVGSTADVLVTGTGSKWDVTDYLHIGGSEYGAGGTGTLRVENEGQVTVGGTLKVWGTGSVALTGSGAPSLLTADEIALQPGATFNWTGQSVVRANRLTGFGDYVSLPTVFYLGHKGGVSGAGAHAVGVGQSLVIGESLLVGYDAPATLDISGGGTVTSDGAVIAAIPGSDGSRVSLTGANSTWTVGPYALLVGGNSGAEVAGALSVANEATVTAGSVRVHSLGTITLDGGVIASTNGDLWLDGGALNGRGTVDVVSSLLNEGVVSPGLSVGLLNLVGDYVQQEAGTLGIELGGTGDSLFDRLRIVDGTATLGGRLQVSLIDPSGGPNVFAPSAGNTFEILTATGGVVASPGFTDLSLPPLNGGLSWGISYNPTSVVLSILGPSFFEADFDEDGDVDGDDLTRWQAGYSTGTLHTQGDADGDGDVDGRDFLTWQRQFGDMANLAVGRSSSFNRLVPEPDAVPLLVLGVAVFVAGRLPQLQSLFARRDCERIPLNGTVDRLNRPDDWRSKGSLTI